MDFMLPFVEASRVERRKSLNLRLCGTYNEGVMMIREIKARAILTRSRITTMDYCLNPYVGCAHGCRYCYATFMKRFTGHNERWGDFVDIKINAVELLAKELRTKRPGRVMISSVTDPYQPIEARVKLTRRCLEIMINSAMAVDILTKSDMVVRDLDILKQLDRIEVGFTITTDSEETKRLFEPYSPSIGQRLEALRILHDHHIPTYVFIGPLLPSNPVRLAEMIAPMVDHVLIDRMNYTSKVRSLFESKGLGYALEEAYFTETANEIVRALARLGIRTEIV